MKRKITCLFALAVFLFGYNLISQTNAPVAVNDTVAPVFGIPVSGNADTTIVIYVLENDYDPDGDPIRIFEVSNRIGQENVSLSFTENTIVLSMSKMFIIEQVYDYRICKVNDSTSISNWGFINVNPCWSPDYAVARNDTIIGMRGSHLSINVLRNDYHPLGDSLIIQYGPNFQDSTINVGPYYYINEEFLIFDYLVSDTTPLLVNADKGRVYIKLLNSEFYDSLDLNNINARFNCYGMQFWNLEDKAHFKAPNGSEVSSIFSQSLWLGGLDDGGNLHVAAERYRQSGTDYWHGPVSDVYDSVYDMRWLHVWNLKREEVDFHKSNWWKTDYELIHDILTWPGNGEVELGQSEQIAPFEDNNNNGIYEPLLGDVPRIRGDQALFFIYNDDRSFHSESQGISLGIEIRAMAYAFDKPSDSALWNTIFIHYDIENRSDTAYHDMYLGVFTDTDLGSAWDDRIECDVENGMYFTFNGLEYDGNPNQPEDPEVYGDHPPAQGIQFLGGPYLHEDGIDNPKYDNQGNQVVDYSINGLNFGDGVVDNERLGMTHFIFHGNYPGLFDAEKFYNTMQSKWWSDIPLQYGGYGHIANGAVGPACNYMWPHDSDPYNWGTNGLLPNGGYNQNGLYWTEEQVGANPDSRRGVGSSGPFEFLPGQVHSLDIALPWARDYEGTAWSSALLLKERAAYIKQLFQENPDFFSKINKKQLKDQNVLVYPNPAQNVLKLKLPKQMNSGFWQIYNMNGICVTNGSFYKTDEVKIELQSFVPGLYLLRLWNNSLDFKSKFIKE